MGTHMGSETGLHMGPIWAGPCKYNTIRQKKIVEAGADPGFHDRGFKLTNQG